jgi:hypothetical protein
MKETLLQVRRALAPFESNAGIESVVAIGLFQKKLCEVS